MVDPTYKEEAVSVSTVTITMNAHREICAIHKMGGVELHADQVCALACVCSVCRVVVVYALIVHIVLW